MNNTPRGNRKHIGLYGKRNAGKSSLLNAILGQDFSLVSDIKGTTTDPVSKAMELIPVGPILLIDTGGIDDIGNLGELRVKKTMETLDRVDLAIYVISGDDLNDKYYLTMVEEFKSRDIPYILVVNKKDLIDETQEEKINSLYKKPFVYTSVGDNQSIDALKDKIIDLLLEGEEETTILGDILPSESKIALVIDNDSAAPKGRLILPQVQVLRDALDNGIKSYVVRNSELESAIDDLKELDLIITDSKIFKDVDKKAGNSIKITSFSILMAREKGELEEFVEGVKSLESLRDKKDINIVISESCSHAVTHEDIGQVKIPGLLRKYFARDINISFQSGGDFNVDEGVDLVIHCGGCMLNRKNMLSRMYKCRELGIPITNYGIFISYMLGILDRAIEIF